MGVVSATATIVLCIIFTYILTLLIIRQTVQEVVIGISLENIPDIAGLIAGLIPIFILHYKSKKYLFAYIPIGIVTYVVLLFVVQYVLPFYWLNYSYFFAFIFPVGVGMGMILSIAINEKLNRRGDA